MASMGDLLHRLPGSEADLRIFSRFWGWERFVRRSLPRVLERRDLATVFQPIFRLENGQATICGYEALSRFPTGPRIPVGLWFRVAREMGLDDRLERLAVETALDSCGVLPEGHFLDLNTSLHRAADVVRVAGSVGVDLVIDLPCTAIHEPSFGKVAEIVRSGGAGIALDDTPLDQLHAMRSDICRVHPRYLKVDVLVGLFDNPMGRFNLTEAAAWCHDEGIVLVAERVEKAEDLETLGDLGVELAQGYSLARPLTEPGGRGR